jgi:hypothetical protein
MIHTEMPSFFILEHVRQAAQVELQLPPLLHMSNEDCRSPPRSASGRSLIGPSRLTSLYQCRYEKQIALQQQGNHPAKSWHSSR